MIIRKEIDFTKPLTPEQISMLEEMEKKPVAPDEDSPAYSKEELIRFKKMADQKRQKLLSRSVTVELSPQTLEKAQSLGESYPSILGKLLEKILNNSDLLKQCL